LIGPGVAHDAPVVADGADPGLSHPRELPGTYRSWAGAEPLFSWEKKQPLPPDLITTGLPTDARPGALGQPNTQVVFAPHDLGYGAFAGVRAFAGLWLDSGQALGLEAGGFVLEDRGEGFGINSTSGGSPLLALRRLDPLDGPDAFVIAAPPVPGGKMGSYKGGIAVNTDSQFWGAEANLLHSLYWSRDFRLVALAGMRYLDLSESVGIATDRAGRGTTPVTFLGKSFAPPAFDLTDDSFQGRNQFYGGQMGLRGEYVFDRLFVSAGTTLALGQTDEELNVLGVSALHASKPAVLQTAPGGLYALPSNSGWFRNSDFGAVPEVQVKGGLLIAPWLRATVGYDLLYWTRVQRPGDQIDLTVDTRQVPTDPSYKAGTVAAFPRPMANRSDFWMQGVTFGLEFTY